MKEDQDMNININGRIITIEGIQIPFLKRLKLVLIPWRGIVFNQTIHGKVLYNKKDYTKLIFGDALNVKEESE